MSVKPTAPAGAVNVTDGSCELNGGLLNGGTSVPDDCVQVYESVCPSLSVDVVPLSVTDVPGSPFGGVTVIAATGLRSTVTAGASTATPEETSSVPWMLNVSGSTVLEGSSCTGEPPVCVHCTVTRPESPSGSFFVPVSVTVSPTIGFVLET